MKLLEGRLALGFLKESQASLLNQKVLQPDSSLDYSNSLLTDSFKWILRIASASKGAAERILTLGSCLSGGRGIVSVTIISLIGAPFSRSTAGPQNTQCVAQT
jgi:hypothetical protein